MTASSWKEFEKLREKRKAAQGGLSFPPSFQHDLQAETEPLGDLKATQGDTVMRRST